MIRHPNAILGNDKLLVTMGKQAELFTLFYPGRDREQHISDSQCCCIYSEEKLLLQDSKDWITKQRYLENTNIVHTELSHPSGIEMSAYDFLHPDMPVLIRNYEISAKSGLEGKFFYYSDFQVNGSHKQNSAFCDTDAGLLAQYNREFYVGLAAKPGFEEWQVGKISTRGWVASARDDMRDRELQRNREEIGNLDNAIGWELNIAPGEHVNYTVFIGVSQGRPQLYDLMQSVRGRRPDVLMNEAGEHWRRWLSKKRILNLPVLDDKRALQQDIRNMYNRSLLCLNLLGDPESGSFVAAPEFDPDFEMCGGYGYCWNRDCAAVVLSLLNAGYPEYCEKYIGWCKNTQLPDGSWFQRYWLDGREAPSWGNFDDSTQIDETGSTLHLIDSYYRRLESFRKAEFLQDLWETVMQGANYLVKRSSNGMHDTCRCLWESEKGIFSYTNAAVYAGLLAAAHMAADYGKQELADSWIERAKLIKKNTIEHMWLKDGYFAKSLIDGRADMSVDASMIGTFIPFNMFSPEKPQEKAMILSMIRHIEAKLRIPVNDYSGIQRYENDNYIGGNPWIVTTLWLSAALLNLARWSKNAQESDMLVNKALEYISWSLKGATDTGLLPEQVNRKTGKPAWAVPLSWSCALMIDNVLLLDELEKT